MVEIGSCVSDDEDMWSEHRPSSEEENKYIESRAGQYKHFDIEKAAAHLHGMIDVVKKGD